MKYGLWALGLVLLLVGVVACAQKIRKEKPPLLLNDGTEAKPPAAPVADKSDCLACHPVADNSRCLVCHLNYAEEELAVAHARARIGCAKCHGGSDAHIADESWASGENGTAPDIMYLREKINPFCMGCHPKAKIDTASHKALLAGTSEKKHCTDCHGKHRLAVRKCKWK